MGYPQHWLTQFGGSVGATNQEIWSCGIRMVVQNGPPINSFDPGEGYLTSIAVPALAAWMTRPTSKITPNCKLRWVKCNEIAEDGTYADQGTVNEYFWPTPVAGGGGSAFLPFQATVVLSWETTVADRGLASKGRIYSPQPAVSIDNGGLFAAADALGMATSASVLLNSLDDSVGSGQIRPHIVSRGRQTSPGVYGPGAANEINRVRVDNRIDTQRRRANQLVAASSVVPFTY